jgi:MGT family glycosyltransferase
MNQTTATKSNGKKILFVSVPADGHFNPLTGIAKHLQAAGYDVRWYTQDIYKEKLGRLQIPHYPFVHAPQLNQLNFESYFAERVNHKSMAAKFRFDLEHVFIGQVKNTLKDIEDIYSEFSFDLVVADIMVFSIPVIKAKLNVPVIAVGVIPVAETSKDLYPPGLGLTLPSNLFGKMKQLLLRFLTDTVLFKKPNKLYKTLLKEYGIVAPKGNVFDILYRFADIVLQSGTPSFEYQRSDLSKNIRFAGSLLPYANSKNTNTWFDKRLNKYERVILLTQGTVEKDVNKLLVPTLEAFKNDTRTLVVCTTGGSQTAALKEKYPQHNIIIEDFIPFGDVMPYVDVYITNGGYGGVMLGIENKLPLVVAGVHEGKNEICARIGYFKYGINLKTETPKPEQIRKAAEEAITNLVYKQNIERLSEEFEQYNPNELCERYVTELIQPGIVTKEKAKKLAGQIYY